MFAKISQTAKNSHIAEQLMHSVEGNIKICQHHFLSLTKPDVNLSRTSTDTCTQFLLTLASERYTIYFSIGRKPGHVYI